MLGFRHISVRTIVTAASLAVLASCATPPPAPPPPPPAPTPTPTPVPARPRPPVGAASNMAVPPIDVFGVRQTVNANLTSAQKVWNLRSALNVAALNCQRPGDEPILVAYKDLLKTYARPLSATNRALDQGFRDRYGSGYRSVRDQYMTQVYNYFALPPVMSDLCDATLQISQNYLLAKPVDLDVYAAINLPQIEKRYLRFFGEYEQWRVNVAAWDTQYGARYGQIYPDYIAAHQAAPTAAIQIAGQPVAATGAEVIDVPADATYGPSTQLLPNATPPQPGETSSYGSVDPQINTVIEPAPRPGFSLPPAAREDAQPQFVSQPVTQPTGDTGEAGQ